MKPLLGKDVQVVSVHNFCPIPDILPKEMASSDVFLLSSCDREERERAVEYTTKTIELADTVDARIVICHFGHVDIDDPTEELIEFYNKGEKESGDLQALLQEAKDKREASQQRNLDSALFSLDKLNQRAEELDVFIGIENRRGFRQIPSLDEIGIMLSEFDGGNIAYWHNTGYAQIHDNLGIADHEDFLKQYSDKMIGVHLHDVKSTTDHMAPGAGDLDFKMVSECLPQDAVRVMQLTPKATREEIMEGLYHLEA
jgi:sugar phosphate isomerase/epimerase